MEHPGTDKTIIQGGPLPFVSVLLTAEILLKGFIKEYEG